MPHVNCCIPFCSADSKRHARIRFYSLPKEETRRATWVALIRNSNLRIDSKYTSVCSLHFPNGKKTHDKKDPSFFPWSQEWPAIINNYNMMRTQLGLDNMSPEQQRKNRPMTLRIPPICPWANKYINVTSQKSLNELFSPKILQCDIDFEDITKISSNRDFLNEIEVSSSNFFLIQFSSDYYLFTTFHLTHMSVYMRMSVIDILFIFIYKNHCSAYFVSPN